MNTRCGIYLQRRENVPVGTLWLNTAKGKLSSVFSYAADWLKAPGSFSLSPDLPLDPYPKACEGLFLCFQDCSPDRWGRLLLRRQENALAREEKRTPRTLLESDFLLRVNDVTRQGALRLSADDGKTFLGLSGRHSVPPLLRLPELLSASRRIAERTEADADLELLTAPGSSLGGARPKASIMGADGTLLIAKFPGPSDERDIPLWEYVTFQLARRAGLRTPVVRLHKAAGKHVLLVSRFDRQGAGRIPFVSAMSMLQARDGDAGNYTDIAAVLQTGGAAPAEDLRELWARMVFNICVYNVDDHLRNHGFLREASGWRLSPVYDLETSLPSEKAPFLHTGITDDLTAFDLNLALDAASFFRFRKNEAQQRLDEIRRAVSCWKQEAMNARAPESEIRLMKESYEYL